jgi:hypothetical protein
MNTRFSLHKIEEENKCSFDEAAYSRFKFGDTLVAEQFGKELFEGFIAQYASLLLEKSEIIVLPSPYYVIPTASNFLCNYFMKELNYFLFKHNKSSCITAKIHRNQTYVQDYGNMSYDDRIRLISNDTYYIDRSFIEQKFCLFIDDIKITGSNEYTVNRILKQYNVQGDFLFLYYAELVNKEVNPKIENHFNYFSLKSSYDLIPIMKSDRFSFNTRIIKYILLLPTEDFQQIIHSIPIDQRKEFFQWAISNNYHQIAEYKTNLLDLEKEFF